MRAWITTLMVLLLTAGGVYGQDNPGGGRPDQRGQFGARNRVRQLTAIMEQLEPLKVSERKDLDLTAEQVKKIAALETAHATRLVEFKDTIEEVKALGKEAQKLATDDANAAGLAGRIDKIEGLAEPILMANRELAAKIAAELTPEQVKKLRLQDRLLDLFPWSKGEVVAWLLEQEMTPEKKTALINAIRESDEALLAKIYEALDADQIAQLKTQMQRAQDQARRGQGGPGGPGGRGGNPLQTIVQELGLTPDQEAKAKELFDKNQEKIAELMRNRNFEGMRTLMNEQTEELKKFLTPEQQQKLQQMLQEMRDRMGGRGQRGGNNPGNGGGNNGGGRNGGRRGGNPPAAPEGGQN